MIKLIERLKTGAYKYRGSERTFSTRLTYASIVIVPTTDRLLEECERIIKEHPDWVGDSALNRLFLVNTPEQGYATDDEDSPYYRVKRFLLEQGIPCQMVDTPTPREPRLEGSQSRIEHNRKNVELLRGSFLMRFPMPTSSLVFRTPKVVIPTVSA